MQRTVSFLVVVMAFSCAGAAAVRGEDKTILMLDTGGHQAVINRLAFTPDGEYVVSAGDDKVIRIWDWRVGKTVRTIRGQAGQGEEGTINALALSPDGRWLAVGVRDVRLYDFETGELTALLRGNSNGIFGLAFSPDSKRLISGSFDHTAILWDVERHALLHRLEGHRREIYVVQFTPDGERIVTGSYDHTLRLWRASDGQLMKEMSGHQEMVTSLAISPADGKVASGDSSGEIRLWDGRTGEFVKTLAQQGTYVGSLTFSPDGGLLISTCGYKYRKPCHDRVWELTTARELTTHKIDENSVITSAFSPDGRFAATAGGYQPVIHIWDPRSGEIKSVLKGSGHPTWSVGFSPDSRAIAWGNTWTQDNPANWGPLEFSLQLPGAGRPLGEPQSVSNQLSWRRATTALGDWSLQHRKGGDYGLDGGLIDIVKGGEVQATIQPTATDGYEHRAYSFTPDGKMFISGGGRGSLKAYRLDGTKIGDFIGHRSEVWAVAPSPDGKYLLSGSYDQTVRLWDLNARDLLVTLFRDEDGEWVIWTPEGFFAGSKKGVEHVGWQINQGPNREARYVTADQLRKTLLRPDLVEEKIAGDPNGKVRQEAGRLKIDEILAAAARPR